MSSKSETITRILHILLDAVTRVQAIAHEDPEVWEQVKEEFNKAKQEFEDASRK